MERSFSVVMDEDSNGPYDEDEIPENFENIGKSEIKNLVDPTPNIYGNKQKLPARQQTSSEVNELKRKVSSPGPSGRQTVLKSKPLHKTDLSSESEDSENEDKTKNVVKGEYDPKQFENLDVSEDIKDIFQYISKYIPQQVSLDTKFKPFVPEFLPAVGDIDAFLKIIPPTSLFSGEPFAPDNNQLGLTVLDEPAANQSDSALLHLQLRAESVNTNHSDDLVIKKVTNVEKNMKTIDKWIKDISVLHKSKSSPSIRYSEPMPDLDELMQEWPEDMEAQLRENNFPKPEPDIGVNEYIDQVCGIFQIPTKDKVESLHMLFSLYAAVKSSQLFKNSQIEKSEVGEEISAPDQLLLD